MFLICCLWSNHVKPTPSVALASHTGFRSPVSLRLPPARGIQTSMRSVVAGFLDKNMEKCYEKHHDSGEYIFKKMEISTIKILVNKYLNTFGLQNWEWVQTEDPWKHTVRSLLAAHPIVIQSQRIYGCHWSIFLGAQHSFSYTVNKWRFPKMGVPSDHPF